ncbi:hypothetical protein SAMN02745866_04267 [Alteromonadaceae bacterium Bs31]|nr:hypothetical protein SAMN02745866_04267 [Alteromonadaceae bacterium Bs31]
MVKFESLWKNFPKKDVMKQLCQNKQKTSVIKCIIKRVRSELQNERAIFIVWKGPLLAEIGRSQNTILAERKLALSRQGIPRRYSARRKIFQLMYQYIHESNT